MKYLKFWKFTYCGLTGIPQMLSICTLHYIVHLIFLRVLKDWRRLEDFSFIIILEPIRTSPFDTLYPVLAVSVIFQKNCRSESLSLASIHLSAYGILCGYSLSLRPVNQQKKQLTLRSTLSDIIYVQESIYYMLPNI